MGTFTEDGLWVLKIISIIIFLYTLLIAGFYFSLLVVSAFRVRKHYRLDEVGPYDEMKESPFTPPVSILIPAFNEGIGIYASVRSFLSLQYPEYEVIVINDGSKDRTLETMIEQFQMVKTDKVVRTMLETASIRAIYRSTIYENLYVIDKENGGKADSVNAGINLAAYPYFCTVDADSILERDALLKVMKPIVESDGDVIATGGSVRIANGCRIERGELMDLALSKNPLAVMQVIEYLRAFLMGRIGLSRFNSLLIISGAFGVFSKQWTLEAGGYKVDTVGEDMELVVRLQRLIKEKKANKRIEFVSEPVCWTEAPETFRVLRKQRKRWHRGLFESLWTHKRMFFNPRYGQIGLIAIPYFFLVELAGPFMEFGGYLVMILSFFVGGIYVPFALLLLLTTILYGSLLSTSAVLLEEWGIRRYPRVRDLVILFGYALSESFWYRPLTVFWRLEGLFAILSKRKAVWGEMTRKGVSS